MSESKTPKPCTCEEWRPTKLQVIMSRFADSVIVGGFLASVITTIASVFFK